LFINFTIGILLSVHESSSEKTEIETVLIIRLDLQQFEVESFAMCKKLRISNGNFVDAASELKYYFHIGTTWPFGQADAETNNQPD
jgi:hypothetical protein